MDQQATRFDHFVIAAAHLDDGAAWLHDRLGVSMSGGGRHRRMGTHNRLLRLGDGRYLEVIAVDAAAPAPDRPRWFGLDQPAMQARLAHEPAGPRAPRRSPRWPHARPSRSACPSRCRAAGSPG
jgi:hypothetical protein